MRAKSLTAGALQSRPVRHPPNNEDDNLVPINTHIPRAIQNGKSVVRFSGTDEYLTGPNTFDVGTSDYTLSLWWYLNGNSVVYGPQIGKYVDNQNYHMLLNMYLIN